MPVSFRQILMMITVFCIFFAISCSGAKMASVSPSTAKTQETYLDAVGEDWIDVREQASEDESFLEDDYKLIS